jgi:uncharacterized membrane protein
LDRTVEGYLAELKSNLAGADPALVQDALYDAEEYLRSAVTEQGGDAGAFEAVVEAYGSPAEVAASYRDAELTVSAALRRPAPARERGPVARFFGVVADPEAWGALFYMLLALVTGVMYFTIVVTGLSLSIGLFVLIIGIPIALLFIGVVRAVSLAEGRVVEGLLGVRMPRRPRNVGEQGDIFARIKSWLVDWRTWSTILYMGLQLPLGIIYFTVVVTALATSLGIFVAPIAQIVLDQPVFRTMQYGYLIEPWAMPLVMAAGVLGFVLTLWAAKGIGRVHGMYAKALLVGRIGGGEQHVA